jgi:saccharopine dehydrogenase (NAD+, L-lysine-forming)
MESVTIGILREEKIPHDKRVPFTPLQCLQMEQQFSVKVKIQSSSHRCYPDSDYQDLGLQVVEDLSDCAILFGIKEVPPANLIPQKTYLFFSHTKKAQPRNKKLLQEIVEKHITLIDYECLTDESGNRVIGFGRYAGIVGAYNGMLGYGKKQGSYNLTPAYLLKDKAALDHELHKVVLPAIKIIITGGGRVANGASEIMGALKIRRVTPFEFLNYTFHEPVYTHLHSKDYHLAKDTTSWNSQHFYQHPEKYLSIFNRYAQACDLLIHCAYWHPQAPLLFSKDEMKSPKFAIQVIADITCDINGSIPATSRASAIGDAFYGYNPITEKEESPFLKTNITLMAVDNLPCELPKDASADFGKNLIEQVLPVLLTKQNDSMITRATITQNGSLTPAYKYLETFIGKK